MILFPNAKINLGLTIVEKRKDGFHNIESCFIPIGWCDVVEFVESKKVSFQSSGIPIPGDPGQNLCLKAFQLLKKDFNLPNISIHLHKNIPIGAGLGGGSADAAFLLKGLSEKYNLIFEPDLLKLYAARLGSDCAFFIDNEPSLAVEKGDVLSPLAVDLRGKFLVVVYPNLHIDTKTAYAGVKPQKREPGIGGILTGKPIEEWRHFLRNDFETGVFEKFPEVKHVKEELYRRGALYASMSGSGSSVFGIFDNECNIENVFPENYLIWTGRADSLSTESRPVS